MNTNIPEALFQLGTKIVLQNRSGHVLLLFRIAKHNPSHTFWELPGGRVQENETPETAIMREVEEETGITNITQIQSVGMALSTVRINIDHHTTVGLIYSFYTGNVDNDTVILSHEHTAFKWVTKQEAATMLANFHGPIIAALLQ